MRLWVRDTLDQLDAGLRALQSALLDHADRHAGSVMPGFTHLQPAQPVTLGHHLLAYVEMLDRDRGRIRDARRPAERMSAWIGSIGRHAVSH